MIFSSLSRRRKRVAAADEKQSHLHIARLIPTPAPYSDVHPYGGDHVTESRSHASIANNTIIITPTQASPTSLGTIAPRSSTQANAGTREPSSRAEDEYESSCHIWPQPSPFRRNRLHTAGEVPNLTGQVVIATSSPCSKVHIRAFIAERI